MTTKMQTTQIELDGKLTTVAIQQKHISLVKAGDTVICADNKAKTVSQNSIKKGFMGISVFGDSYCLGSKPVSVIDWESSQRGRFAPKG
jgi:hypothetical protein